MNGDICILIDYIIAHAAIGRIRYIIAACIFQVLILEITKISFYIYL